MYRVFMADIYVGATTRPLSRLIIRPLSAKTEYYQQQPLSEKGTQSKARKIDYVLNRPERKGEGYWLNHPASQSRGSAHLGPISSKRIVASYTRSSVQQVSADFK